MILNNKKKNLRRQFYFAIFGNVMKLVYDRNKLISSYHSLNLAQYNKIDKKSVAAEYHEEPIQNSDSH